MANDDRRRFSRDDFDRDDDRDNRRTQVIRGTHGNDVLIGTSGNDNISGSRGHDTIHAGAGHDRVRGDDGDDTLYGDGGNDALDGGRGNDTLLGGTGNDDLDGGDGNDLLFGDSGNDDIKGGKGDDVAFGGTGNDELEGGDGNDTLAGDDGDDEIDGGKGHDILAGGAGADELEGDEGNDVLTGGAGNDEIDGGKGFDVATFDGSFDDYRVIVARHGHGGHGQGHDHHGQGHGHGHDHHDHHDRRLTVIDVRNGSPDGIDRLENIEALQFADRTIYLDGRNNGPMARADVLATHEDSVIIIPASRLTGNDSDFDGDSIRITAVGGAVNASVALDAAGNIVITPAANFSGTATFTYTLTDARGGTDTGSVTVNVAAVADAPALNASNVTGNEDSAVALNIGAALTDLDGSESLKVVVSGVPASASLSAGVNNGDGSWTLGAADLAGLTITPSADSDADFTLSVTAIATESSNGSSAETVRSMTVTINAVADAPVVSAANVSGNEDGVIGLDLSAALTDTDGSEALAAVTISGVPAGATLSAGTHNPDGSWSLTSADLAMLQFIPAANFNGPVNLQVTVASTEASNGSTAATSQSFTVTVIPVNDAPVITEGAQSGTTTEDNALTASGQFTATDVDDGATQTWSVNGGGVGSYGSLSIDSSGAWTYTLANGAATVQALAAGESHEETFAVRVTDDAGAIDERSVSITVTGSNDGPVITSSVAAASGTATEELTLTTSGQLAASDMDAGATQAWSLVGSAAGTYGSLAVNDQTGAWTYTLANGAANVQALAAGESHVESFTVRVMDDQGATAEQIVNVIVRGTNDGPVAIADTGSQYNDVVQSFDVLANDSDVDTGDTRHVVAASVPAGQGSVSIVNDQVVFNPGQDFHTLRRNEVAQVTITYTIADAAGAQSTSTLTLDVIGTNTPPVAHDVSAAGDEDGVINGAFAATDDDNDPLTYAVETGPQHGNVVVHADGTYTYTPGANYNGADSFTYKVTDTSGESSIATVALAVNAVNDGPQAVADSAGTDEDIALVVSAAQLLANDTDIDAGDTKTLVSVQDAQHGTVSFDGINVTFIPDADYNGPASFSYTMADSAGATSTASVNLTVNAMNDAPVAFADSGNTDEDISLVISASDLLANDADIDSGDTKTLVSVQGAAHGTVSFDGTDVTFVPDADYNGPASFSYTMRDAAGLTSTATVNLTVNAQNDVPVAIADSATTNEDIALVVSAADLLANDTDVDSGDTRTLVSVQNASHGTVSFNGTHVTFVPDADYNGPASFTYTMRDAAGATSTATVNLTVNAQNDAPVAFADSAVTNEDTALVVSAADLLVNDTDVDAGDTKTLVSVQAATHGTVSFNGTDVTFIPDADYNGAASFTYTMRDAAGAASTTNVQLTVQSVNDAPVAMPTVINGIEDSSVSVVVPQVAYDVDQDDVNYLSFVSAQSLYGGTVQLSSNGLIAGTYLALTFTPDANYAGPAMVEYTVRDLAGATSTSLIAFNFAPVMDAPVAVADSAITDEDTALVINAADLVGNDIDPDGSQPITVVSVQDAAHGTVSFDGAHVTFIPDANYYGTASFTYTVVDADWLASTQYGINPVEDQFWISTATVNVTVNAVNDAPTITSGAAFTAAENQTAVGTVTSTDVDGGTPVFAIAGGADAAFFTINAATGALRFVNAPSFETPQDAGANNVYDLNVQVADGQGGVTAQALAVSVTNVNEAPVITSPGAGTTASVSVAEGTSTVTVVTSTDPDAGATKTFSISGGADAGKFVIGASTGVLSFAAPPNFEAPTDVGANNVYDVDVRVSDGSLTDTQSIAVTVTNVNEPAVFTSSTNINVAENQTAVATVAAVDPDAGTTPSYSIAGGVDAAKFTINAATGALSFITAPNFEAATDAGANNIYNLNVQVSDGNGGVVTQALNVTVTNVNEAPVITSNGGGATAAISLTEGTTTVSTITSSDPDAGATRSFTLSGADAAKFTINATTGVLSFIAPPDFENPGDTGGNNVYDVNVVVSDGSLSDTQSLAITVLDGNDAPVITSNGGGASAVINLPENTLTVTTVSAADPGNGSLVYAIAGGADASKFTIDATTGKLSFVAAPNFEAAADFGGNNIYDVIVSASDGVLVDTQALSVSVTNVNEAPVITSNGGGDSAAINVRTGTTAVTAVAATDLDAGSTLTYSLSGTDAAKFTIDATGHLKFVTAPDRLLPTDSGGNNVYDVTVRVSDGTLTDSQALAVKVGIAGDDYATVSANSTLYALGIPSYNPYTLAPLGQGSLANVLGGFNTGLTSSVGSNQLAGTARFGTALMRADDAYQYVALNADGSDKSQISFFGNTYDHLYVNNNGSISFNTGVWSYSTQSLPVSGLPPMIAPFWSDVDTRSTVQVAQYLLNPLATTNILSGNSTGSNLVYYNVDARSGIITVTWDDVGYFSMQTDKLNSFQLQLIPRDDAGGVNAASNYDVVFRYEQTEWMWGQANSFGSYPQAGFSAGDGVNYYNLPGSGTSTMATIETASNINVPGVFVYNISGSTVSSVPNAGATGVLANDGGISGAALRVVAVDGDAAAVGQRITLASGARLLMSLDGTYVFNAAENDAVLGLAQGQSMLDSFTYTVQAYSSAGVAIAGATTEAVQYITVNGANDGPVARADLASVSEDLALVATGDVLANDTDPDNGAVLKVQFTGTFNGTYGSLVLDGTGHYTYTLNNSHAAVQALNNGQTLSDTINYSVIDEFGASASAALKITINGVTEANRAPITVNDNVSALSGSVLINDSDPDGTVLKIANPGLITGQHGTLSLSVSGTYVYHVDADDVAVQAAIANHTSISDTFTYTATDGTLGTAGTLNINFLPSAANVDTSHDDHVTMRTSAVAYGFAGGIQPGFSTATTANPLVFTARTDDGFRYIDLSTAGPGGTALHIDAFGNTYSGLFLNANGSVSFGSGMDAWSGSNLVSNPSIGPMIAPFWADIDMQNLSSGQMYYNVDASGIITVTWDHVGSFNNQAAALNTFQLQLVDRGDGGFDSIFHYGDITWTQSQNMAVTGQYAWAGAYAGDGANILTLPGSGSAAMANVETGSNLVGSAVPGTYILNADGTVPVLPSPLNTVVSGSVLANDPVGGSSGKTIVTAINDDTSAIGHGITLASGALLTMYADGSYIYRPGHAFDGLSDGDVVTDGFFYTYTYTPTGGVATTASAHVDLSLLNVDFSMALPASPFDIFAGTALADTLTGSAGSDFISGMAGADTLYGDAGSDTIFGGNDNDILSGGTGSDQLIGGSSRDVFVFKSGETGVDTITDFTAGSGGDALDIRDLLTGYTPASSIGSFVRLDTAGANTNVMIDADGAGAGGFVQVATLQGVTGLLLNDLLAHQNLLAA